MLILIHSSKSMRDHGVIMPTGKPVFQSEAIQLSKWLKLQPKESLALIMQINTSKKLDQVYKTVQSFGKSSQPSAAIEAFIGDIYSGLQARDWTAKNMDYAQANLRILSGLYGILRPLDAVEPYRLEMGYRFKHSSLPGEHQNMYSYWGKLVEENLPSINIVIDLTAKEYSNVVHAELKKRRVIRPKFMTINHKSNTPRQVVVHTKIARGAFARWLIVNEIEGSENLKNFNEIGYSYSAALSTSTEPVFIARKFDGVGLSVRLT